MEQIYENNEPIADFMELTKRNGYYIVGLADSIKTAKELNYHCCYNALIPVLSKIESLGFWSEILSDKVSSSCHIGRTNSENAHIFANISAKTTVNPKLTAIYHAVLGFISWYKVETMKETHDIKLPLVGEIYKNDSNS